MYTTTATMITTAAITDQTTSGESSFFNVCPLAFVQILLERVSSYSQHWDYNESGCGPR
jgi:hypothetical protein